MNWEHLEKVLSTVTSIRKHQNLKYNLAKCISFQNMIKLKNPKSIYQIWRLLYFSYYLHFLSYKYLNNFQSLALRLQLFRVLFSYLTVLSQGRHKKALEADEGVFFCCCFVLLGSYFLIVSQTTVSLNFFLSLVICKRDYHRRCSRIPCKACWEM